MARLYAGHGRGASYNRRVNCQKPKWVHWTMLCGIALWLVLGTGCPSSDYVVGVTEPVIDLSGKYSSTAAVGDIGQLVLALLLVEGTSYFNAVASSTQSTDLTPSEGIASLGDFHLVINFDRGLLSDYYFEGQVIMDGTAVQSLDGQFVFPDQAETLAVSFVPTD